MRLCGWLLGLLSLFSLATHASDWQEIKNEAKGQTVWFNAWGGDTAINRYLDWVSGEMKTHYAINLKIVRLADAPRDKCTLSCAINGIHAAFHYLKKNYISGCVMTVPTG